MQDRVRNSWRRDLRTWRVSHVYGDFYSGYFPTKKLFFLLYRQESWNSKHGVKELLRTEPGLAQAPRPDTEFLHHRKPTVRRIQVHQWWPPLWWWNATTKTEGQQKTHNSPFRNTTSVANSSCMHFSCSSVERQVDWMEFKQKRRNRTQCCFQRFLHFSFSLDRPLHQTQTLEDL